MSGQGLSADQRQRILDSVDAGFDAQLATTKDFVAIPSTRGAEGPCQDMIGDLLRARGYEVDDWHIDLDDLKDLPGFGPIEHDFSKARTVVGTYRPTTNGGRSLILQGHCDVVPAGPLEMWETPPFSPAIKDNRMYGRGACDMKSGTIGALYALDAIKAAGLAPTGRIHFQSVIEEESTGVGALSTLQRGYRADCCFIPEPTGGQMVRSQVGVIWFRLKVRGFPVHVFEAGSGSNAIMAAYHLIEKLQAMTEEWNRRALADKHFCGVVHPINFNPGIIKGGDWASSVPAWCDVDCRIAILPGWSVKDHQNEIMACVASASRDHRFLSNNPPQIEWSGFLSDGYELVDSAEQEAAFGRAFNAVYGGEVKDLVFTALTDTRFYGLNYGIPSLCFGASGAAMHGFNEYVDLDSLRQSTRATALFIAEWCGVEPDLTSANAEGRQNAMTLLDKINAMKMPFAELKGIVFVSADPDRVVAKMVVRPDLCTLRHTIHGGAVMAFADSVGAAATVINLPEGAGGTTTLESKTNFIGGAKEGTTITATATPIHKGRRTQVWTTRIETEEGKLVGIVTQTQLVL